MTKDKIFLLFNAFLQSYCTWPAFKTKDDLTSHYLLIACSARGKTFLFAHSQYVLCLVCHVVTTRKTTYLEMGGKTPLSSKTRKKQSQQRASRSHKQQKPPLPPQGSAAERPAARPWTWVPQRTTQETRTPKTRYTLFCLFVFG